METQGEDFYTFSYHPPPEIISKAYAALIKDLGWDKFTILYEDDGSKYGLYFYLIKESGLKQVFIDLGWETDRIWKKKRIHEDTLFWYTW